MLCVVHTECHYAKRHYGECHSTPLSLSLPLRPGSEMDKNVNEPLYLKPLLAPNKGFPLRLEPSLSGTSNLKSEILNQGTLTQREGGPVPLTSSLI